MRAGHWRERKRVKKGGGQKGGRRAGHRVGRRVKRAGEEGERREVHFVPWEPKPDCET